MAGKVIAQYVDYSDEKSSMSFATYDVTAGNVDTFNTAVGALLTAIDGIILGNLVKCDHYVEYTTFMPVLPSDQAYREQAWLIWYTDDVTADVHSLTIPCADPTQSVANSDVLDILDADVTTFIAAFEAVAISKFGGNSVSFSSGRFIGRNN